MTLYEISTRTHTTLTENIDISFATLAWTPDSESIITTAPFGGRIPIFQIRLEPGSPPSQLVNLHTNGAVQVTANGVVVFSQSTMDR